jgi:hypothetical protein
MFGELLLVLFCPTFGMGSPLNGIITEETEPYGRVWTAAEELGTCSAERPGVCCPDSDDLIGIFFARSWHDRRCPTPP